MPKPENPTGDDRGAKSRPFIKIDIVSMRGALPAMGGGETKVWLAYMLRANRDGIAWPSLKTLGQDTGLSCDRISKLRASLIDAGSLIPVGKATRNQMAGGRFGSPKFRVLFPSAHRTVKTTYGENTARQEKDSPYGENNLDRTVKTTYEVDSQKYEPPELDGASRQGRFKNLKIVDPRFEVLRRTYLEGFWKKWPNLKPPFEPGDGKMLNSFLARQPQATADELTVWLKNAFASDDTPPLRPMFRLREFCAHAEKYAVGPLKRVGAVAVRSAAADSTESARLDDLVIS
jgi:hypothetical protein